MAGTVRLRFLGTVQVERDGAPVGGFRSRKALALLGYLAIQERPLPRERLADLFWADQPEARGRANLSWVLSHITALLPGCLQTDRHTVSFPRPAGYWLDTDAFCELEGRGDTESLAAAAGLVRGEFLEGLYLEGCAEFELWLVGERERWRQRVVGLLAELVAHHSRPGGYDKGLHFARRLLALEPWREETHRQVMRLLARSGQRAAALAQYEACRQVLAEELAVEPAGETVALYERLRATVRRQDPMLHVPCPPTPLVGREEELAEIVRLLAEPTHRLLTLVGPGGIGKTHLALQAATEMGKTGMFLEGAAFVPLGALASPDLLVSAIAEALHFSFHGPTDAKTQLLNYLHGKEMLLVLDNFEHLLEGVHLLAEILTQAPEVKLLVTSRERLNLQAECLLPIEGLRFPADEGVEGVEDYGAVKLFVQSARRVRGEFTATAGEMPGVVTICRLVGGMPLGLLLAAAWVDVLIPADIATEIEGSLDFLKADLRDLPARQRSMQAVFDHSWRLLDEEERAVFRQLSVFRGGFNREAAQQVAGASLNTLRALVAKSLLRMDSRGRYEIHELLRQYGTHQLRQADQLRRTERAGVKGADVEAVRDRHCTYYAHFLQQREAPLTGRGQRKALAEIEMEIDNIRAAWDRALDQARIDEIERSLAPLARFCRIRGWYREGETLFSRAAQRLSGTEEDRGRLLYGKLILQQGRFAGLLGNGVEADRLQEASLAIFRELGARRDAAHALCLLGGCEDLYGSLGRELCLEGLGLFKELGDQQGIALALHGLAWSALHGGEYAAAKQSFQESLALFRQVGDMERIHASLHGLGYVCWILGEYERGRELHLEMLRLCQETGSLGGIARALGDLGIDAHSLQQYDEACELFGQSLAIYRDIGNTRGIYDELGDLAETANAMGEYARAERHVREAFGVLPEGESDVFRGSWEYRVLGNAACGLGNYADARRHLHRAMELGIAAQWPAHHLLTLVGMARVLAKEGDKEGALELLALVMNHRLSWQMAKDQAAPLVVELEAELPPEAVAAAWERGQARDLDATVAELLVELGGEVT